MNKEQNFVSAVVFVRNNEDTVIAFFEKIAGELDAHFEQYELIAVNGASEDCSLQKLEEWGKSQNRPLTVVHMSTRQSREACMNAGLDAAVGDYVYAFDSVEAEFPEDLIFQSYEKALEGNDIVSVCPSRQRGVSFVFYFLFNSHSNSPYKLRTNAFTLVSRRAIHRVHAISSYMPYRKAAFASCGLKCSTIEYAGCMGKQDGRVRLAEESLLLYTNLGYRVSMLLSVCMILVTLCAFIYAIVVYCLGKTIVGWTTTTLLISVGFTGVFLGNSIIVKYLALILELHSKRERYLIENIEKIQK